AVVAIDYRTRTMFASRRVSPLAVGISPAGVVVASDTLAFQDWTDLVHHLEDGEIAELSASGVVLVDGDSLNPVEIAWKRHSQRAVDHSLHGHPDFMSKEIFEQ